MEYWNVGILGKELEERAKGSTRKLSAKNWNTGRMEKWNP